MLSRQRPIKTCQPCLVGNVECSERQPQCEERLGHHPFRLVSERLGRDEHRASFTPIVPAPVPIAPCSSVVSASSVTSIPSALPISRASNELPARRILAIQGLLTPEVRSLSPDDLELLANWCTTTYRSLTHDRSSEQIWRNNITREALRYPFLLDSILALSALQLAYYSEQDGAQHMKLLGTSQRHWVRADAGLAHEISRPFDSSNCTALFAQCNIQITFAFAFFQLTMGSLASTSALNRLCRVFRHIREPTRVLIDLTDIVREGEIASLATPQVEDPKMPNTFAIAILGLKRLNIGQEHPDLGTRPTKLVYSQAIDQLEACLAYTTRTSDPGILGLSWVLKIPSDYLDLVQNREPFALIILAHYCVIMYHLRKRWWMGDWGVRVLEEVCGLLGRDWLATISWAIDATGIRVTDVSV